MNTPEKVELDESRITKESQVFATVLFARFPNFRQYAKMYLEGEMWILDVTIPAPSGDPKTQLGIWVLNGIEPSVEFGCWHTHENVWAWDHQSNVLHKDILDLVEGILKDRFVLCEDVGGVGDGSPTILDFSDENALLDELTSKYSPGRARLRSWSGRLDRLLDIADLDQENQT